MATFYWVGGSGTWDNSSSTRWATSSGGAGSAGIPSTTDNVIFDSLSNQPSGGAYTVTIATGATCANWTAAGASGGNVTFAGSSGLSCYGGISFASSGITRTYTGAISFAATTSVTLNLNGTTLASSISFIGTGGSWQLTNAFTTTGALTFTRGTLDMNNYVFTALSLSSSNSNTRTLAFGTSGAIYLTGTGSITTLATSTNLTVTGTPNISSTYSGATSRTIAVPTTGATEANSLSFYVTAGNGAVSISGTNGSIRTLDFTGFTGTFSSFGTNSCTLYGNLVIVSGMTYSSTGIVVRFAATSGTKTIDFANKTVDDLVAVNGSGGTFQLVNNVTVSWSFDALTIIAGTLDLNGYTFTASAGSVNFSSGNLTFNAGVLSVFRNVTAQIAFTTTAGTGTGKIKMSKTSGSSFFFVSTTFNCTVEIQNNIQVIFYSGTITTLSNLTAPCQISIGTNQTLTVTNFSVAGTAGNLVTLDAYSTGVGTVGTLSKSSGTVSVSYLNISNSTATGGASWRAYTSNGNTNSGGNTGWIFNSGTGRFFQLL